MKKCTQCKTERPYSEFYTDGNNKSKTVAKCKICIRARQRKWARNNKETKSKHRQRYKNRQNELERQRAASDPIFAMQRRLRARVRAVFRDKNISENNAQLLGCSYESFLRHIERQFLKGMSWDNKNEWHLDHITPISSAKNEKELLGLFHYTNIRPIWASDNLSKNKKIEFLI